MNPTNPPSIPIGLRGIKIENFRGIDSLEMSFYDAFGNASDIVVLAGPNGCGKTTVLEACLLALGYSELLRGPSGHQAIRRGAADYQIAAQLQTPSVEYLVDCQAASAPRWRIIHGKTISPPIPAMKFPCLYFSSWRAPKLVGSVPITAGRHSAMVPYVAPDWVVPGQEKHNSETESDRLHLIKQYLVNAKAHAAMRSPTSAASASDSPYEQQLQKLNEVWRTFYPDTRQQFAVEPVSDDSEAGFDVFLNNPDLESVSVDSLSSGQLELFTLFGSLLRLKFSEGLLVIDEPELHLDPQWHGVMLKALRQLLPKVQIIVATHSTRVYDSVLSFQSFVILSDDDPRARGGKTPVEVGSAV